MTVLLVEDTEDNRFMMRRLLEMTGYRVVEATNGEEAVSSPRRSQPDLILMDLSLPVIDGLAATRADSQTPNGFRRHPSLPFQRTILPTFWPKPAAAATATSPSRSTSANSNN